MIVFLFAIGAFAAAIIFTVITKAVLLRFHFVDDPDLCNRKIHGAPVPIGGGVAIFLSVALVIFLAARFVPEFTPSLGLHQWFALVTGSVLLFVIGALDDRFSLPPYLQIIGPIVAAALVIFSGIQVQRVTNPFGGIVDLAFFGLWIPYAITFAWLIAIMYGAKLLDGLDGLCTGLGAIAAIMIFALTQTEKFFEPSVGFVAFISTAAFLGFLIFNFHPARIFLGEGGALFIGFTLGVLAILSGSKIATTLMVMGLPVIDVLRVAFSRARARSKPWLGDQRHLHHLLLKAGLSHKSAVFVYYAIGIAFGLIALFAPSFGKVVLLLLLLCIGLLGGSLLERKFFSK